MMSVVHEQLLARPYLQVGGNETVGMGWFYLRPVTKEI